MDLFEFIDNAEYYTAGSNACKDYMGELAPFTSERRLELFEEIGRIGLFRSSKYGTGGSWLSASPSESERPRGARL